MRLLVLLITMLYAWPVYALDWGILPNDSWAGDATVNVEWAYTAGSASGPVIGAAAVMQGPLLPGQPRLVSADQFDGRGETVCLTANAIRGVERSVVVSDCTHFRLGPPILSAPR
jgi:hypothetical protein